MPIVIREQVPAESTAGFIVTFYDETETLVTPDSVVWSLVNGLGDIINGRDAVSVAPASSVTIVLSGDDLIYADGNKRYLLVEAVYDSDLGVNLPLRNEIVFQLAQLVEPD